MLLKKGEGKKEMINLVVLKASLNVGTPIGKRACHHAAEDEVKFFGVCPRLFSIIDFEPYIWWNTGQTFRFQLTEGHGG